MSVVVYGDQHRDEWPNDVKRSVEELLDAVERERPGPERHALLVRTLIRAGELAQGIADAEFELNGFDKRSARQNVGAEILLRLAEAVDLSRRGDHGAAPIAAARKGLALLDFPSRLRIKRAEGFAHYALYPETYLEAAKRSGLGPNTPVIGIRSIGLSLAALVAAALGAKPPVSVRPVGHPFSRTILAAPELSAELARAKSADFAVVDEGPGLSGSSFATVADWLEEIGIAPERIHFFPGHVNGPGPEAGPFVRDRWNRTRQHWIGAEKRADGGCGIIDRLEDGIAAMIGPLDEPLREISGGGWRQLRGPDEATWPPCDPRFERRKFLAASRGKRWLVKFAGLDEDAAEKLECARSLAGAGYTPPVEGLCRGFLVERWIDGTPLDPGSGRAVPLTHLADYLGFRANLPAPAGGASLDELVEMACHNCAEALGEEAADELRARLSGTADLEGDIVRCHTDNRLHVWEWLVTGDGRLIKTDAVDHGLGHDLVGCQDIAWDMAGAAAEHGLSRDDVHFLSERVRQASGRRISGPLLAALTPCYLAFQLGLWTMAAASAGPSAAQPMKCARRYRDLLVNWIREQKYSEPRPALDAGTTSSCEA